MKIEIDDNSGYCFGVEFAIQIAEDEMARGNPLYCLGDIVHNRMEVERLARKGLKVINHDQLQELRDCKVLIRAHGEPPETYELALKNNIELVDASCPVVLKLQNRVKGAYDAMENEDGQVVIYGKPGHAEVVGLTGQTRDRAIVITSEEDLDKVDFTRPVTLFSQTTKSTKGFYHIKSLIEDRMACDNGNQDTLNFKANDSICRQVSNREPQLETFSQKHDLILFIAGHKSSNGKALYGVCKEMNPRSYFIESDEDLDFDWIKTGDSIGICGATSTPKWLMEKVADHIRSNYLVKVPT